jgi:hypothetical protein
MQPMVLDVGGKVEKEAVRNFENTPTPLVKCRGRCGQYSLLKVSKVMTPLKE